jgi:hypothetical protein
MLFKLNIDILVNYTIGIFSANKTVLVFKCCEPSIPSSVSFDPCYTTILSTNLFQFKIDENHHMNDSCRFLAVLKKLF